MTDPFVQARANALLTVYRERWDAKWRQYDILEVEQEFCFPLLNPDTEASSRSFLEAGKIDVLVRERATGRLIVVEHKTTSDSVAPESDYWDRLRMDTQCSKYYLAAHQYNYEVGSVIYDVIGKPAHRPSQVPLTDENGFKIVLDTAGNRVFTKDGKKPRETADAEKGWTLQSRHETPEEFEARLLMVLRANTDAYFAQREVPRLDTDILEYMKDAWSIGQTLLYHRGRELWPRNPQACKLMGTCEYLDLCCGRASVDGIRFRQTNTRHPEMTIQERDEKQLLTASRIAAWRKCPRFHKLRYEDLIERVDDADYKEALTFGTIIHQGLEQYFLKLKTENKNTEQ